MWTCERITADAAAKMQTNAGLLVKKFTPSTPKEPADQDIVCETTGSYKAVCKPLTNDMLADVNGAPKNTKEGKRLMGWEASLTVTCLSMTEETLKLALGAADGDATTGIKGRGQYTEADFQTLYWLGDMMDETKLLVIQIDNGLSTDGLNFTSNEDGKGNLALNIMAHPSTKTKDGSAPMTFYLLTKQEGMGA